MTPEAWILCIFIAMLVGFILGRRSGIIEGYRQGVVFAPIEFRRRSLEKGRCSICGTRVNEDGGWAFPDSYDIEDLVIERRESHLQSWSSSLEFVKMHGLGNDFVVLDWVDNRAMPSGGHLEDEELSRLAIEVCDRHFGVGADGMVLILPSEVADLKMRIFNSDGSEARMCGNATRCIARYAYETGLVHEPQFLLETLSGIVSPSVNIRDGEVVGVTVNMGEPVFKAGRIPVISSSDTVINQPKVFGNQKVNITCVSMGNPHCVIFVDDLEAIDLHTMGPLIENDPMFPDKINVEFVQVRCRDDVKAVVWERGAGPTLACGTGACAIVASGVMRDILDREVSVELPGGVLQIRWDQQDNHIYMTGPAQKVFRGFMDISEITNRDRTGRSE